MSPTALRCHMGWQWGSPAQLGSSQPGSVPVNPQNSAGGGCWAAWLRGLCREQWEGLEVPGVAPGCWPCVRGSGVWLGLGACALLTGGGVSIVPLAGAGAGWEIQAQLITALLESPVRGHIYKHTEETGCKHSAPRAKARPGPRGTRGHEPLAPPPAPGTVASPWDGWGEMGWDGWDGVW